MKAIFVIAAGFAYGTLMYTLDRVHAKKATAFEELLGAKWRCRFFLFFSDIEIGGVYRDKKIEVGMGPWTLLGRWYYFGLLCPELPRQKRFLVAYPTVTRGFYQRKNKLETVRHRPSFGREAGFAKAEIASIFDELIEITEGIEASQEK